MSQRKLTKAETMVFVKGISFTILLYKIPGEDFIVETEKVCVLKIFPEGEKEQLRDEIRGALKSVKPPNSNISKQERLALKDLRKADTITILPADKGRATVVMDSASCDDKVNEMPGDEKTYTKLKSDPTPKYREKLVSCLCPMTQNEIISQIILHPKDSQTSKPSTTHCRPHQLHRTQCVQLFGRDLETISGEDKHLTEDLQGVLQE